MRSNIWKGNISFGLLNIPVTLQTADQDRDIHFSMLDKKDLSRINYKKFSAQTGKEVPYDRIVKGFEFEKGHYVVMNEGDFKKANVKATQTIDIEDFVLMSDVDPLLFEKPYYLAPQKGAEKGYYLLREALKKTKKVAIAKIVIRVKQHLVMLMPRGDYIVLEILRFAHQIKSPADVDYMKEVSKSVSFSARELKMAEELIEGMTAKWTPLKYKDTYYNDMMKMINQKVKAGKGHVVQAPPSREERVQSTSNVVDLMPLLKQSLEGKSKTVRQSRAAKEEKPEKTARTLRKSPLKPRPRAHA